MNKKQKARQQADEDAALADDVQDALDQLGWSVPRTERDVQSAEARIADRPPGLPDSLKDPAAVLDGPDRLLKAMPPAGPSGDSAADAALARAAREAGRLTPETEAAMRRDREEAQRAADPAGEDDHGTDSR